MSGKPTIPTSVHDRIRSLYDQGMTMREICAVVGCSKYTVRKAIDPAFVAAERARMRARWPLDKARRAATPGYAAMRRERYFDTDAYRAAARERSRARRAALKREQGD